MNARLEAALLHIRTGDFSRRQRQALIHALAALAGEEMPLERRSVRVRWLTPMDAPQVGMVIEEQSHRTTEEFTPTGEVFRASDGFWLGSSSIAEVRPEGCYLRGSDNRHDYNILRMTPAIASRLARAIEEYNAAFNDPTSPPTAAAATPTTDDGEANA